VNGICVLGDVNFDTGEMNRPVNDVTVTGFTIRGFSDSGIIAVGADNATFSNNVAEDNDEYGITAFTSSGTRMLFNRVSGAHEAGFYIGDSPNADAKLVGNESFDSLFGVLIRNALQGSVVANSLHDNCAAVAVLADAPGPAGLFNVTANRITHNTKSCPASDDFPSDLSGIGVALFGATGVTVAGNTITGNVPGVLDRCSRRRRCHDRPRRNGADEQQGGRKPDRRKRPRRVLGQRRVREHVQRQPLPDEQPAGALSLTVLRAGAGFAPAHVPYGRLESPEGVDSGSSSASRFLQSCKRSIITCAISC
jgi:parallel beta-helix repeat protein